MLIRFAITQKLELSGTYLYNAIMFLVPIVGYLFFIGGVNNIHSWEVLKSTSLGAPQNIQKWKET
jgi:hypothetical protein